MNKIRQIFQIKEIRDKILFILAILVVFRLAANIPVPGVDVAQLKSFFDSSQLLGMLDLFSGGGLRNISIVMLGVGPYITASIIMQLSTMIFPRMEKMHKEEGEAGRQKFNLWTRWLTLPLAIVQSFSMIALLKSQGIMGGINPLQYLLIISTITAGTVLLMWLGEIITEKGLGNGVSLIIFAGIVSALPTAINNLILTWNPTEILAYLGLGILSILTIGAIVFITEGQRNIPITFARQLRGGKTVGGSSNLPLKVNMAGVIPIIFAMSIMLFPSVVANFLATSSVEVVAKYGSIQLIFLPTNGSMGSVIFFWWLLLLIFILRSLSTLKKFLRIYKDKEVLFLESDQELQRWNI